ncbi:MAG: c-type cytochrome [Candidatus Promineifilaceae bacterium]|jgi:mono/diheme cytochrome c family protein
MRKYVVLILTLLLISLVLAACSNGELELPGDPVRGEDLYNQQNLGTKNAAGCPACHTIEEGVDKDDGRFVGPSHHAIGTRAENAVPGMSAEEYIRQSIVDPNAHIVEGYDPWVMYTNYAEDLSETDIDDLVSYLLTLR